MGGRGIEPFRHPICGHLRNLWIVPSFYPQMTQMAQMNREFARSRCRIAPSGVRHQHDIEWEADVAVEVLE
jgi:hypothetical protein